MARIAMSSPVWDLSHVSRRLPVADAASVFRVTRGDERHGRAPEKATVDERQRKFADGEDVEAGEDRRERSLSLLDSFFRCYQPWSINCRALSLTRKRLSAPRLHLKPQISWERLSLLLLLLERMGNRM
jgi:hypothetical protein